MQKECEIFLDKIETAQDKINSDYAYTTLFRETLLKAHKKNVSDIHFQPVGKNLEIRFRLFGKTFLEKVIESEHRSSFLREVKNLTGLSIAIQGKIQDGVAIYPDWQLKVRSSALPTNVKEDSIVLRLIDLSSKKELSKTGLETIKQDQLKDFLYLKSGLMIMSGPTGSGKSSTLNALINEIDLIEKRVITLEDPDEYPIEGACQVRIKKNLNFSDGLKAAMRQDPDVILVGEIRDIETAKLAVNAAQTGHLVLTTIHANNSLDACLKLVEQFSVNVGLAKSVLSISCAQRLMPIVCKNCSRTPNELESEKIRKWIIRNNLKDVDQSKLKVKGNGCKKCNGTGLNGRKPIIEIATRDDIFKKLNGGDHNLESTLALEAFKLAQIGEACIKEALCYE